MLIFLHHVQGERPLSDGRSSSQVQEVHTGLDIDPAKWGLHAPVALSCLGLQLSGAQSGPDITS